MAQRFGGKYSPTPRDDPSPTPPHPFDGRAPARAGTRSNLMFAASLLFLPAAFTGTPRALLFGLAATGLMLLGAWLTREGLRAETAYDLRSVARRPAFPRKLFGAVLTGAALAAGALMTQAGPLFAAFFALAGTALHLGAFGLDPMRDKGAEGVDSFQTDRVARAVDEGEKHLSELLDAISRANDRQITARAERFAAAARALFRGVEQDPRDLTAARKYLSVYLIGARDASVKFADLYARTRDAQARTEYLALLDDLETTFAGRSRALLDNNRADLDIEIEVLRDRLKLET